jgi:CBS domain-containing protein
VNPASGIQGEVSPAFRDPAEKRVQKTVPQKAPTLLPVLEFLAQHAPFSQMAPEHRELLAKQLKPATFSRGEVITEPGDGPASRLYIIRQGRVRGESAQSGDEAWELVAGEAFPIGALLANRPVHTIHRAVDDTLVFELEGEDFRSLLQKSPPFHDFCTRRLANLLDDALRSLQLRTPAPGSEAGPLNTPVGELVRRAPVSCEADDPLERVLDALNRERIGSMVITDRERRPLGIFTLHDLLARVVLPKISLGNPVREVMSRDVLSLNADALAHQAALLMTRRGVGHLCVVDVDGRLTGVVSERDLFALQRIGLVGLSQAIAGADSVDALADLVDDMRRLVMQMLAQGVSVDQLNQIVTELNDGLTRRIIDLVLAEQGPGCPPFTWLSFGSEGRYEQTLKTDQDNGILFELPDGATSGEVREALLPVARRINDALARCGFPLCPGNVMASNPDCCLSTREWQDRFERWIDHGTPEHLLNATIYFDFRPLYGDPAPAAALREWLTARVQENSRFRRQMAANALRIRPALGLFGDLKVSSGHDGHPHTIDLKLQGVTPFVDGARILAFANGVTATNTIARLRDVARTRAIRQADADTWIEAYQYIQLLRMRAHHEQAERGEDLGNHLDPDTLNAVNQRVLKESFRQARRLQSRLALDYQL